MAADLTPLVSIIIPVFRRTEWVGPCMAALSQQDAKLSFEVVLVDDGSPDRERMEQAVGDALSGFAGTAHYYRKENAGPAAARNFGVARSKGSILCFIDDDSMPDKSWLREITAPLTADAAVSVVSGGIRSWNRKAAIPMLLEQHVYQGMHWATCNIAYRRDVFLALGGFDEQFREASWEDNDLGLRARWAGYCQVHRESAVVHHPHEESLEEYRRKCLVNGRGAAAFSRKYLFRKPLWALAAPVIMSRHLLLAVSASVIGRKISGRYLKFLWSYSSLIGFIGSITGRKRGNNP